MIFSGTRLFSAATRVLVNAMEGSPVRRLICVTGLGAGDSRGRGGLLYDATLWLFLGRIYADKDAQEWIARTLVDNAIDGDTLPLLASSPQLRRQLLLLFWRQQPVTLGV